MSNPKRIIRHLNQYKWTHNSLEPVTVPGRLDNGRKRVTEMRVNCIRFVAWPTIFFVICGVLEARNVLTHFFRSCKLWGSVIRVRRNSHDMLLWFPVNLTFKLCLKICFLFFKASEHTIKIEPNEGNWIPIHQLILNEHSWTCLGAQKTAAAKSFTEFSEQN